MPINKRVSACSSGCVSILDGRCFGHGNADDVAGANTGLDGLFASGAWLRPAAAQLRRLHGLRPHAPGPVAVGFANAPYQRYLLYLF